MYFSDFRAFMKIKGIPIEPKRESGKKIKKFNI
jgi:hypothetical protein|uniref:Uncharacterized protein n=1 Tax=viral metagenome TaxID=1070528 RepID=A0A6C0DMS3_9ZZZZ